MPDSYQRSRPFSFLMWLIVTATFCLSIGGVSLMFRYGKDPDETEKARVKERKDKLQFHRDQDKLVLENYCWANEQKKIPAIPIARAMELQIERLKQKKPYAAAPIVVPTATVPAANSTRAASSGGTSTNQPTVKKGDSK